jgi:hypothetical protein
VQQRRELGVAPLARRETELVDDLQRQLDHVAAVSTRVLVVGLDDVSEQERGPAVGVAQLELVVDPHPPLTREHREQRHQRERKHDAVRRGLGREGNGEPDGARPASIA